jgi:polyphosphate kinase
MDIIEKTGEKPFYFVRTQEKEYRELYKGKDISDGEWIKILSATPKLLQRPIVVNGNKAVIARPPEMVDKIV